MVRESETEKAREKDKKDNNMKKKTPNHLISEKLWT